MHKTRSLRSFVPNHEFCSRAVINELMKSFHYTARFAQRRTEAPPGPISYARRLLGTSFCVFKRKSEEH